MNENPAIRKFKIFDSRLEIAISGKALGDCHPKHEGGIRRIWQVGDFLGIGTILAPSLAFTNGAARFRQTDILLKSSDWHDEALNFYRTKTSADGVWLDFPRPDWKYGLVIANADCHVGVVYNPKTRAIMMLHLGLKCFCRDDGSDSILAQARQIGEFKDLWLWAGLGIGPCCNGYNLTVPENAARAEKIRKEFGNGVIGAPLVAGPRKGQISFDNLGMIRAQALKLGFGKVQYDETCTSCHGLVDPNKRRGCTFFSNVRDWAKTNARNCVMVKY